MNNNHDTLLQTVFADAKKDLEGEAFTARVIARTRSLKLRFVAGLTGLAVVLLAAAWIFATPIMEIAQPATQVLTTSLFDLGEGSAAWIFSPVNNIASLLILSIKALRVAWKRFSSTAYEN
jgi:hypothetical protein